MAGDRVARAVRSAGRRPGVSGTREAILAAALRAFATSGFRGASLRAIANDAGVDPALIRHYFGDKASLFAQAVADGSGIVARMSAVLDQRGPDQGRRAIDAYLGLWEDPDNLAVIRAMIGTAMTAPEALESLRGVLLARVASRAPGGADSPGVALAASQLLGLAFARYVIQIPSVAAMPRDELLDLVAPTIDRYLALGEAPA
ncbi:TetR/AcrR family transcriptional regulator [Demequina silvatica]|uniref:TetR/AcrR family transcriptional regulator n=1 Tax=Demequina silvatica TaxID=1638988 RepID=UPI0007820F97|nr:TetR family transcriptional regulator [Demequina silvatica]